MIAGPAVESHPVPDAEPVNGGVMILPAVESLFLADGVSRHAAVRMRVTYTEYRAKRLKVISDNLWATTSVRRAAFRCVSFAMTRFAFTITPSNVNNATPFAS
jgi:hypothetical protein